MSLRESVPIMGRSGASAKSSSKNQQQQWYRWLQSNLHRNHRISHSEIMLCHTQNVAKTDAFPVLKKLLERCGKNTLNDRQAHFLHGRFLKPASSCHLLSHISLLSDFTVANLLWKVCKSFLASCFLNNLKQFLKCNHQGRYCSYLQVSLRT